MTDREKVIKALEHCSEDGCNDCPYETDCMMADGFELAKDTLELLKGQESVEPILALDDGEHKLWQCGNCKVAVFPRDTTYCHHCGRKVKWDE